MYVGRSSPLFLGHKYLTFKPANRFDYSAEVNKENLLLEVSLLSLFEVLFICDYLVFYVFFFSMYDLAILTTGERKFCWTWGFLLETKAVKLCKDVSEMRHHRQKKPLEILQETLKVMIYIQIFVWFLKNNLCFSIKIFWGGATSTYSSFSVWMHNHRVIFKG